MLTMKNGNENVTIAKSANVMGNNRKDKQQKKAVIETEQKLKQMKKKGIWDAKHG